MRIYVISDGQGFLKVGITGDMKGRMRSLQTANARRLQLVYLDRRRAGIRMESLVHSILAPYHASGEWFQCEIEAVLEAIESAFATAPKGLDAGKKRAWREASGGVHPRHLTPPGTKRS